MTNEEILANAPDGATHFDQGEYMRFDTSGCWHFYSFASEMWLDDTQAEYDTRMLSDIRRIVELEKRLETPTGLQEVICVEHMKNLSLAEIHRANQMLHEKVEAAENRLAEVEREREQRDIEQQERVIDAAIDLGLIENDRAVCDQLRQQLNGGECE